MKFNTKGFILIEIFVSLLVVSLMIFLVKQWLQV